MSQFVEDLQPGETQPEPITEAHEQVTRKEKCRKLAEVVQDAYNSGSKLYTKRMFREIELCLSKHAQTEAAHVCLPSMTGSAVNVPIPRLKNDEHVLLPVIYSYRRILDIAENAFNGESDELLDPDISDWATAFFTCPIRIVSVSVELPDVSFKKVEATWSCVEESWIQSDFRIELEKKLGALDWFPKASRVVCLELGHLADGTGSDRNESSCNFPGYQNYVNHFIALTVGQVIASRQKSLASPEKASSHGAYPSLRVLAEDSTYSLPNKRVLTDSGFQILNGHGTSAFRVIDDETVFICCDPRAAVKEVIADIEEPAAMLWINLPTLAQGDEQQEGQEHTGAEFDYDDSPRTVRLLNKYKKYDVEVEGEALIAELFVRKR